jgi:ATP-dependent Clp protease protease subunit
LGSNSRQTGPKLQFAPDRILARHTAQSLQRIRQDTERDYFMDPSDAMEYGLIDDILQRRENLPNN